MIQCLVFSITAQHTTFYQFTQMLEDCLLNSTQLNIISNLTQRIGLVSNRFNFLYKLKNFQVQKLNILIKSRWILVLN